MFADTRLNWLRSRPDVVLAVGSPNVAARLAQKVGIVVGRGIYKKTSPCCSMAIKQRALYIETILLRCTRPIERMRIEERRPTGHHHSNRGR